jgi:hypothetical protein
MPKQIKLRRGTAAQWTAANPVLAIGEVGVEYDTEKVKVGNGVDAWADLTYVGDVLAHTIDTTNVHGIADTAALYRVAGTDVAVADGGTGSSTAAGARTNLGLAIGSDVAAQHAHPYEPSGAVAAEAAARVADVDAGEAARIAADAAHAAAASHTDQRVPTDASVTNAKVASDAAIAKSKLAPLGIVNADVDAAAAIAKTKLAPLGIVNADVDDAAAIAKSKLAALAIVNADIDAAAAIAKSKLAALAIVNADVDAAAAIAESKLNLASDAAQATASRRSIFTGTPSPPGAAAAGNGVSAAAGNHVHARQTAIVNSEVDAAAAIALSKLAITGTPDGTKYLKDNGTWAGIASTVGIRAAAAADDVFSSGVTGDAQDRFVIDADGTIHIGTGAAAPLIDIGRIGTGNKALQFTSRQPEVSGTEPFFDFYWDHTAVGYQYGGTPFFRFRDNVRTLLEANYYGLKIGSASGTGATVDAVGGSSIVLGNTAITVNGAGGWTKLLLEGASGTYQTRFTHVSTGGGWAVRAVASQTAPLIQLESSAGTVLWSVTVAGLPRWNAAGNEQTTVGAAGAASALPATPTKFLKVVDSAGTTLVIPAYAAA